MDVLIAIVRGLLILAGFGLLGMGFITVLLSPADNISNSKGFLIQMIKGGLILITGMVILAVV